MTGYGMGRKEPLPKTGPGKNGPFGFAFLVADLTGCDLTYSLLSSPG